MRFPIIASALAMLVSSAAAQEAVTVNFAADIGGKPFACAETYPGIGSANTTMSVTDFRLFISDPALIRADGSLVPIALDQDGQWQFENAVLLDFEDATAACSTTGTAPTNTSLRGTVEPGDYVGLSFEIGLPLALNHGDPTVMPAPLNTTGMFWSWQSGFRFLQVNMEPAMAAADAADGGIDHSAMADAAEASHTDEEASADHGDSGGMPSGWFMHLGSTECASASQTEAPTTECGNPNRVAVLFPEFDQKSNVVVFDPAPVVAEANMTENAPETAPGCMAFPGDTDCNTTMPKLGLPFDGLAAGEQLFATVR